jgi:iron(II)-dependent oxidoreductase
MVRSPNNLRQSMREKLLSTDTTEPAHGGGRPHVNARELQETQETRRRNPPVSKERLQTVLAEAREQTRTLLAPLNGEDLTAQHSTLMSPLVWDLAHIGWYEEYWLLRKLGANTPARSGFDEIYDAFSNPREDRPKLPLLEPAAAWRYCDDVRTSVLEHLDGLDLDADNPLLGNAFVYGLVAQHELQHNETMLQTLQLRTQPYPLGIEAPNAPSNESRPLQGEAIFEGGHAEIGSNHLWSYDNERPITRVATEPYAIDLAPVTNATFEAFVADAGYDTQSLWTSEGWRYITSEGISAPLGWEQDTSFSGWTRRRLGNLESLPAEQPVQHVSWYEADACARWLGKRLPTETEWEIAASWDPARQQATEYPWGDAFEPDRANVGRRTLRPAAAGSLPAGASALGCHHMTGDVWEWTASDFLAYPNFEAFPYKEYSEVFFGPDHKVLRGGSWATSPAIARTSFRNWDYPIRRQLFVGFRCARTL